MNQLISRVFIYMRRELLLSCLIGLCFGDFTFECQYSAFSGPVANLILGESTNPQILHLGLRFGTSESAIYAPWECPPFVRSCFKPEASATLSASTTERILRGEMGERSGLALTDLLRLVDGSLVSPKFPFTLVTVNKPANVLFRDVAGYIGMGKNSEIFQKYRVAIEESDSGLTISFSTTDYHHVLSMPSPHAEKWSFVAESFRVGSEVVEDSTEIVFDPHTEDIVIPSRLEDSLLEGLLRQGLHVDIDRNGRLTIEGADGCQIPGNLYFEIILSIEFSFQIDSVLLGMNDADVVPERVISSDGSMKTRCPLRLRISHYVDDPSITIGRHLLRSVKSLVLDYPNNRIGFQLFDAREWAAPSSPFPITRPMIPGFALPLVDDIKSKAMISFHGSDGPDALYLVALHDRQSSVDPGVSCWEFFRTVRHQESSKRSGRMPTDGVNRITGLYSDVELLFSMADEGIHVVKQDFRGTEMKQRGVSIIHGPMTVRVCIDSALQLSSNQRLFGSLSLARSQTMHESFKHFQEGKRNPHVDESNQASSSCFPFCFWRRGRRQVYMENL